MNRKRYPKKANMANLKIVDSYQAYNGTRLKKGVYGIISRDTPFIYKNVIDRRTHIKKPKYINDMSAMTNLTKQEVISFFDDPNNRFKRKCYLIEK